MGKSAAAALPLLSPPPFPTFSSSRAGARQLKQLERFMFCNKPSLAYGSVAKRKLDLCWVVSVIHSVNYGYGPSRFFPLTNIYGAPLKCPALCWVDLCNN